MQAARPRSVRQAPLIGPMARFVLLTVLYWAIAWLVNALLPALERGVIAMTAGSLFQLLRFTGFEPVLAGTLVSVSRSSIEIVSECTSLVPSFLLIGATAAFPAPARQRVIGVITGVLGLWIFNLVRLVVLLVILMRAPGWFDFAHVYLWQTVSVLAAAALFALWLRWAHRQR